MYRTLFNNDEVSVAVSDCGFTTVWFKDKAARVANHFDDERQAFIFAATKQADKGKSMWEQLPELAMIYLTT